MLSFIFRSGSNIHFMRNIADACLPRFVCSDLRIKTCPASLRDIIDWMWLHCANCCVHGPIGSLHLTTKPTPGRAKPRQHSSCCKHGRGGAAAHVVVLRKGNSPRHSEAATNRASLLCKNQFHSGDEKDCRQKERNCPDGKVSASQIRAHNAANDRRGSKDKTERRN